MSKTLLPPFAMILAFLAAELPSISGAQTSVIQTVRFETRPFAIVAEEVERVVSAHTSGSVTYLRLQFGPCGFGGRQDTLRVVNSKGFDFRPGSLVATAAARRNGQQVALIRSVSESEARELSCIR